VETPPAESPSAETPPAERPSAEGPSPETPETPESEAPKPDANAVREQIEGILVDKVGRIEIDRSGLFSFPYGSARVFVNVTEWDGRPVVNVWAYTNMDVDPSEDLYRYVAMQADAWIFGHMGAKEQPDGKVSIVFRNTLLGTHLTSEELMQAVGAVGWTADQVDEEIKGKFGGRLSSEPLPDGSTAPSDTVTSLQSEKPGEVEGGYL